MATPLTIAIPPLREGQTIAAWQPLFVAAVSSIEDKAAVKLLPAYVKRGRLEEKVGLRSTEKDTLEEAFAYLKERLDPEEDEFLAGANFRRMTWTPGEPVQDFFARYLEEATKAKLRPRAACALMVSQAPAEVQLKLKDWVRPKEDTLSVEDALGFGPVLRRVLEEKGIPTDRGCRVQQIATVSESEQDETLDKQIEPSDVRVVTYRSRRGPDRRQAPRCFACGSTDHFIRTCPAKVCSICGEKGHKPADCPSWRRGGRGQRRRPNIYQVADQEEAVTVEVKIGQHKIAAMLDTGARPSVIDIGTVRQLGLEERLVRAACQVYGLCNNPVMVCGYIDVSIEVGTFEPVLERMQVLDSAEPTLLLGRKFMGNLGPVTFDWENSRVKIGRSWISARSLLSGATPLARAMVANQDEDEEEMGRVAEEGNDGLIPSELKELEKFKLSGLVTEFNQLFASNHKRPSRCRLMEFHTILTGDASPQKVRPRRIPPHWDHEISRQLEEMLSASPPICQPSKSPWASDVVLVKKKDGNMRFAIDYRRLNAVTKRDEYSLPNPQSIFDRLEGSKYFSKLDVASAY